MKLKDLQPNQVIHIRTKKEAKAIRKLAKKQGIWHYKNKLSEMDFPYGLDYDSNAKYLDWGFLDFYKDRESTILPASQFLKKTTKERVKVLEMHNQILREQMAGVLDAIVDNSVNKYKSIEWDKEKKQPLELEVGKWYKTPINGLSIFFVTDTKKSSNDTKAYGFDSNGFWYSESWGFANCISTTSIQATPKEVCAALIAEAKKRGINPGFSNGIGGTYVYVIKDEDYFLENNWLYVRQNSDTFCKCFEDGIWAEIVELPKELTELPETPKEIDFSVPGQIISLEHGLIVLTTGVCDIQTFEGISVIKNEFYYVGEKQNWYIKTAKPYTGEPIILK